MGTYFEPVNDEGYNEQFPPYKALKMVIVPFEISAWHTGPERLEGLSGDEYGNHANQYSMFLFNNTNLM